jgi:uncharacterized membrane protein
VWEYEHAVETDASAEAIWALWADVENWGEWNHDIEHVELRGQFAIGSEIWMTPVGQETVQLRLAEVSDAELFVDEAAIGDVVVRTTHRIDPLGSGRVRVVYRMEITGPGADTVGPQIGPAISADFPETIEALVRKARA